MKYREPVKNIAIDITIIWMINLTLSSSMLKDDGRDYPYVSYRPTVKLPKTIRMLKDIYALHDSKHAEILAEPDISPKIVVATDFLDIASAIPESTTNQIMETLEGCLRYFTKGSSHHNNKDFNWSQKLRPLRTLSAGRPLNTWELVCCHI